MTLSSSLTVAIALPCRSDVVRGSVDSESTSYFSDADNIAESATR